MLIHNSLTSTKQELKPITPDEIKIYVCGQTVYDACHIGHARSMIAFDMIVRYLRLRGFKVIFVRNITDVDDKIIIRSNENHESCDALTKRYIDLMHKDENDLHLLPPTFEPRATETIQPIIALIQKLLDEKIAYIAGNGDVCFEIRKFKEYGKLSKRDIEKLISGARIDINEGKKDPLDFVLWKLAKPGEPQWESPWGNGRPGWHIECSAMAKNILGQPFDIHGGGMDLKFPHHENEIAQSEAAFHTTFANTWMHVGLLNVEGEKMSKSLKNFFTIQEVLAKHPVEVVRYFMLSAHYRSPVDYSDDNMEKARQSLMRLYTAIRGLNVAFDVDDTQTNNSKLYLNELKNMTGAARVSKRFVAAMDDDFNSPIAISVLFDMAHEINILREAGKINEATKIASQLKYCASVFGFLQTDPNIFLQGSVSDNFSEQVENLIAERNAARKNKDYVRADRVRAELQKLNVVIEDAAGKTTWRIK